jgi:hypothetical protein
MTRKNIIYVVVALLLLVATIIIAVSGFGTPKQIMRVVPLLSYDIENSFTHQAHGYLNPVTEPSGLTYFAKILNAMTGSYSYEFSSDEPVSDIKTQVQVTAIIKRGGLWSKEIVIVSPQTLDNGKVGFPINSDEYVELASTISEELGFGSISSVDVTLKASTLTQATIDGKTINEQLVQTCDLSIGPTVIEWKGPLSLSRKSYQAGAVYTQEGLFGYTIDYDTNLLFGAITLESPKPAARDIHDLKQADRYGSDIIDSMDLNFDYKLLSDKPVSGVTHQVQVNTVLSDSVVEQVLYQQAGEYEFTEDFKLDIPVDVTLLYDIIRKQEGVTGNNFDATYDFDIRVDVNTLAGETGEIDETINAVLPMRLSSSDLAIGDAENNNKSGSITTQEAFKNQTRDTLLLIAASLLGLTILAWLYAGWMLWEHRKRSPLLALWEATEHTIDSHKDILVNMTELPAVTEGERITPVDSLEELVKLSDALLKPVLHQVDGAKHNFCVIDGTVRYEYSVLERPSNSMIARRFKDRKESPDKSSPEEDEE